jgi:hypothetical protein
MALETLRGLPPASAWHDAGRRAIPFGIVGYFVVNLFSYFGALPALQPSMLYLPGFPGAAGLFLAALALLIAYYHKEWIKGMLAAAICLVLPYLVNFFWFRVAHLPVRGGLLGILAPTMIAALPLFVGLHALHRRLSKLTTEEYQLQLSADDYGAPKKKWEKTVYWVCVVVGIVIIITIVFASR